MMNAMSYDPIYRAAFQCEQATKRQEVFNQLRCLEATMGQQPVKTHADSEASRNPPEHDRYRDYFPAQHEECGHRANMKNDHEDAGVPLDGAVLVKIYRFAH
jgi:hypothetical protein